MTVNHCAAVQYDGIADAYMRDSERPDSWNNLYERPIMLNLVGKARIPKAIDLGAATGFYSEHLASRGTSVIAVDSSDAMLRNTRARAGDNVATVRADLTNGLPFVESDSHDLIVASLVLHYLENWSRLVSDFQRVLKKDGRVLISIHHPFLDFLNGSRSDYHASALVEDSWGTGADMYKVRFYTTSMQEVLTRLLNRRLRLTRFLEPPLPSGLAGRALGCTEKDRWRPGLLILELTKT